MSQTEQMMELAPQHHQKPQNFSSQQRMLLLASNNNNSSSTDAAVVAQSSMVHANPQDQQNDHPTTAADVVDADTSSIQQKNKRKRSSSPCSSLTRSRRRVSFSDAKAVVVEVQGPSVDDKRNSWYGHDDYYEFMFSAHRDAQVLKEAAQSAQSPESLFHFIQSNPDLCPRGLEKVLAHFSDEDDEDSSEEEAQQKQQQQPQQRVPSPPLPVVEESRDKRMKKQKVIHRRVILSMHRFQKETGEQNPEEIRKFSEDSSKWAVETALKLGHIDAAGLI